MIIAISNGPIVPMLLSSRLISPKLLEVFSTSRFATLALHISATHTELFRVVNLKKIDTGTILTGVCFSPDCPHGPHGARWGESSWSVRTGSLERPVSQRLSCALLLCLYQGCQRCQGWCCQDCCYSHVLLHHQTLYHQLPTTRPSSSFGGG